MGKGELVLWRRGEGKRGGLKTLMVTMETETVKTKKKSHSGGGKAGNDAFTHENVHSRQNNTHKPSQVALPAGHTLKLADG